MKTAPQITASLIIHQSILLNKHNRSLLPEEGQKPTWDSDSLMKNRSSPSVLSTLSANHSEEIALHLEADSGCTHTSQNIHMYIHRDRKCIYTPAQEQTYVCAHCEQARTSLFNTNVLIQQEAHLASFYLQEKYLFSLKTGKRELPGIQEKHMVQYETRDTGKSSSALEASWCIYSTY